jgi:predicted permease
MTSAPFSLLVKVSGIALFQVFYITAAGFMLKYLNIMDVSQVRAIGRFISNVLYPCLMFTEVLRIWDLSQYHLWLPLFLLNVGMLALSYTIVTVCGLFFKIKPTAKNLMVCLLSFPNTGALPLIFIGALKDAFMSESSKAGGSSVTADTFEKAVGFIMLNACIQTILRWSIGYDLMRKPAKIVRSEETHDIENELTVQPSSNEFMMKLKKIMNPTLVASIVAIMVASFPIVKELFYQETTVAPLYNYIFYPLLLVGQNGKSIMTLQLGLNLAMIADDKASDEEEELDNTAYVLSVVLKMLLYPFVALIVVMPLLWAGFMYDPMQAFIALLQIASPSAITLTVITNVHKFLEKETAKCFMYQYATSIVTLTLSSALFLSILF